MPPTSPPPPTLAFGAEPGTPRWRPSASTPKTKSAVWKLPAIIGTVIVLLAGGGYVAYSKGFLTVPFLSPKSDQLFDKLVDSLSDIKNAQYTVQASLAAEPRDAKMKSIFPSTADREAANRDTQRRSHLAQIRTALTQYFGDQHRYPDTLNALQTTTRSSGATPYLSTVPTDPKDHSAYTYQACDQGRHFLLLTGLESGEHHYATDITAGTTVDDYLPTCGASSGNQNALLRLLLPTANAQVSPFTIESVGDTLGLGAPSTTSYPMLNLLGLFGLSDIDSVLDVFPSDINTTAAITFYGETDTALKDADALLRISGAYRGGDLTAEFDLEGRKLGPTIYGTIRKFPGIPYLSQYITPIKGKWIKLAPDDGNPIITDTTFEQKDLKQGVNRTKDTLRTGLRNKVVTVDKQLPAETITGVQSAHYRLALHSDKLADAYRAVIAERKAAGQDTAELDSVVKQLETPSAQTALQRIADASTVEVWIDKAHGFLRQARWSLAIVPPEGSTKLQNQQLRLGLTLTLNKVNQTVSIDEPSGAIGYDEAERLITGISPEEQSFNRQRQRVDNVRQALSSYHFQANSYPETINDLPKQIQAACDRCLAKQANQNTNVNGNPTPGNVSRYNYSSDRTVNTTDVYTNKPYGYQRDGDKYKLTYEMRLDFSTSGSTFSYGSYYRDQYAEGTNTATPSDVSIEKTTPSEILDQQYQSNQETPQKDSDGDGLNDGAEQTYKTDPNKKDTDGDGLTDYDEIIRYRTNPLKADTDGDGYPDKTEIDNGYNPNGSGKLLTSTPLGGTSTVKPSISNVVTAFQGQSATVTWTTNISANTILYYRDVSSGSTDVTHDVYLYNFLTAHTATFPVTSGHTYQFTPSSCPNQNDRFSDTTCSQSPVQIATAP